jgi:hypothetical protein
MPMTYTIDEESPLVRIAGAGRVTDEEIVQCISSLRTDPKLEHDMNALADFREIEVGFTAGGVNRVIEVMEDTAHRRSPAKAAIVVDSDVAFGMSRMIQLRCEGRAEPSFGIFRDMSSARAWLVAE